MSESLKQIIAKHLAYTYANVYAHSLNDDVLVQLEDIAKSLGISPEFNSIASMCLEDIA